MKVAVASALGWPYVRRGSRFTYELAAYLARKGHQVHYITTKPGTTSRYREKDGFITEYHRLWSNPLLTVVRVENLDTFISPCLRSILKNDFDIVQTILPMDAFAASVAKTIKGISFVHYMIDSFQPYYYLTRYGRLMLKRSINSADRVTAPSNFIIKDIKKHFDTDALLTPPAVDTDQFTLCANKDLQNPVVLYTSSIHDPRKGFITLVKAFEKLLDHVPQARLQLSGHVHPKAVEIVYKSVGSKAGNAIEILGVGRRQDLPFLYRQAALTVLPSVNEAFGMVLLESLASGTPVVGSNSGGIPEIINNNEIGRLYEPDGGSGELCNAILKGLELAQDPVTWKKCRRHAKSFSWDRLGPQFENLYLEILDARKRKRKRKHLKNRIIPDPPVARPCSEIRSNKTVLKKLFDDTLDDLEIDYDNYYIFDRYKPLCIHILGWLLNNGIRKGNVLLLGAITFPLTTLLGTCGFNVRGIRITPRCEPWRDLESQLLISDIYALKKVPGSYDVIICDDIVQHFEYPGRILQIFKNKLKTQGIFLLTTENAMNRIFRLFMFSGKNIFSDSGRKTANKNNATAVANRVVGYHKYKLDEVKKLISDAGFTVDFSEYAIREKAIQGSLFPVPIISYFYKHFLYFVQMVLPRLRSHVFTAARKTTV